MSADATAGDRPVHSVGVLADRIAAALVHREPGWRLPRRSALARRYNVSLGEIDLAIRDLARRSLVRRLPDGQLYRASPADYWIPVEGATGLSTRVDPMGSPIECQARHVALREAPQDVAWAIGVLVGAPVQVVRCVWALAGEPAAISTMYLPEPGIGDPEPGPDQDGEFGTVLEALPGLSARPAAVSVEMSPPQPSAARSLRLSPGQPVTTVTIRFEDREQGAPAGLTVVMLRPELFRVAIDTAEPATWQRLVTAWTRTGSSWHPSAKMPAEVMTRVARMPRRARYLVPKSLPRRGELLAVCAVVVVAGHLLFAQLTLLIAVTVYTVGKVARWRAVWLLGPAAAGLVWTIAAGPGAAIAGFTAGPDQVFRYLMAGGHFLHPGRAFPGMGSPYWKWGSWLPRQLPVALLTGTAEAGLASWLSWLHTDEWNLPSSRPGLFVMARRSIVARSIRTGGVVTREGGCLGIETSSGGRIAVSWPEANRGVLVCGAAEQDVLNTGFQLIYAALRRRKPVVVIDFTTEGIRGRLAAACQRAGVPLQVFPGGGAYEPFRSGDPGQRAALVAAMMTWDGQGSQHRRGCTAYLTDVFELLDAAPGDPRVPVLDEVIHLLDPAAMRARAAHVPPGYPRRTVLVERAEVSASLVSAQPATVAALSRQLRAFRGSSAGRWLGQPVGGRLSGIELGSTISGRGAALFCLGGSAQAAGPEALAMLNRLVCQDLLRLAASLRVAGGCGDGVIWLAGCQAVPERTFADLVAAGPPADLAVVATTASAPAACTLAEYTNALVVHRTTDPVAARGLAAAVAPRLPAPVPGTGTVAVEAPPVVTADDLLRLGEDEFVLAVRSPRRLVPRALAVRARA